MTGGEWTPDAITGLLVAITGLLGAIGVVLGILLAGLRKNTATTQATAITTAKTAVVVRDNTETTDATHELVNNLHDEDTAWRSAMEATLKAHGIALPVNPGVAAAAQRMKKGDR